MHDRRGVDRSEPFTDAPFQPITASEGTKHARVKDGASRLGAELIGQLTAREMIEIGLERGVQVARHACQYSRRLQPKRFCSAVTTGRSTVVCYIHLARPRIVKRRRPGSDRILLRTSNPPHLMASLELGELAHEGSSDIRIDLAVKKDWRVGFPKLRGELVQVLQRADGRSLKTEALCDWRKIHVWEHRFSHGLLPEPRKMQLCAIGTIVHQHYHYRQILALPSRALPSSSESRRRRQPALWFCLVGPWRLRAQRRSQGRSRRSPRSS